MVQVKAIPFLWPVITIGEYIYHYTFSPQITMTIFMTINDEKKPHQIICNIVRIRIERIVEMQNWINFSNQSQYMNF